MNGWRKPPVFLYYCISNAVFCVAKPGRQTDDPALLVEPPPRAGVFFLPKGFFSTDVLYLCMATQIRGP